MKLTRLIFILPFFFFNCNKEQAKVSWIKIDKWDLLSNSEIQMDEGELTHNIDQVFVNMEGEAIGGFELPAKIPLMREGATNLILIPGVVNNGIRETKVRYPFYQNYTIDLNLEYGDTITLEPTTKYLDNVKFLIEDFESPSMNFETDPSSVAQLYRDNDPAFLKYGDFYGRVDLNDQDSIFTGLTTFGESWPKQNQQIYLELDYMITNSVLTSVLSFGNNVFHEDINVQVMPRGEPEWRKIYIELREIVSFRNNAPFNESAFTAILDMPGEETYVILDNIKIVYQ